VQLPWELAGHHSLVVVEEFVEEERRHCIVAGLVAVVEVAEKERMRYIVAGLVVAGYLQLQWQSRGLLGSLFS
jgi:hypothetical protein